MLTFIYGWCFAIKYSLLKLKTFLSVPNFLFTTYMFEIKVGLLSAP